MSRAVYNGITFDAVQTKSMEFRARYSDDGLEYLWTEITHSFSAIVSLNLPPSSASIGNGTNTDLNAAATIRRIRWQLTTPRKMYQFWVDPIGDVGNPLIQTPPTPSNPRDPMNGPLPQSLTITRIDGTAAIWVDYTIKTAIVETANTQNPTWPAISSHRWSESVSIDENFFTTKTRNGTVYCRGDLNKGSTVDIDNLRELFCPAVPKGFKLQSASFTIDPSGLKMNYTHVFKEQFLQPPWPATKASGTFAISSNIGAVRMAECSVRLEGGKTTPKDKLLRTAILVVCTKLRGVKGHFRGRKPYDGPKYPVFKGMSVREGLFENWVEVNAKAQLPATSERQSTVPIGLDAFGIDVGGDNPPDLGIRGSAGLLIRAAQKYLIYDISTVPVDDWRSNPNAANPAHKVT